MRSEPLRAIVTTIAVALGVGVAFAIVLATGSATRAFSSASSSLDPRVDVQVFGAGRALDDRVLRAVRYDADLAQALPAIDGSAVTGNAMAPEIVRVHGVDLLRPLPGVSGLRERFPTTDASLGAPIDVAAAIAGRGAILSAALAERLRVASGDRLNVRVEGRPFALRVAGVLAADVVDEDSRAIFVDIGTAQEMFERRGTLDRIDCIVANAGNVEAARARLEATLPAGTRVVRPGRTATGPGRFLPYLANELFVFAVVTFFIAAALVYQGVGTSILRRGAEIATLRTLGATKGALFRAFLCEGALYGALGSLFGLGCGQVVARAMLARMIGAGTSAQPVTVVVSGWLEVAVFVAGVAVTSAAAALAARAAMRVAPAGAMSARGSESRPPRRRGRRLIVGALTAGALVAIFDASVRALAPAPYLATLAIVAGGALLVADLAQATGLLGATPLGRKWTIVRLAFGTFRALPHRLALAAGVLTVALSAVVGFAIASASFGAALERWAAETYRGDLLVSAFGNDGDGAPGNSLRPALRNRARRIEGVIRVDGLRSESVRFHGRTLIVRGDDGFAGPATPRAGPSPRPQPALASRALARSLHLQANDVLTLATPAGSVPLRIAGIAATDAAGNGALTVSRLFVEQRFHDDRLDALRVAVAPRTNLTTLRSRLARLLVGEPVVVATTRELRDRALGLTRRSAAIVDALAAVCLAMSLIGTASAAAGLIYERRRDIALLRYLGATRTTVRNVFLFETFVWAALGSVAGVLLGFAVAAAQLTFVNALAIDISVSESIPSFKLAAALVATIGAALLAALAIAAGATRLPMNAGRAT